MSSAGFEPAFPKETELKSVALDHSAMMTKWLSSDYKSRMRTHPDLNWGPIDLQSIALPLSYGSIIHLTGLEPVTAR